MKSLRFHPIMLALVWLLVTPLVTLAQTPATGGTGITIEGQVTHAATGEAAPGGLLLMLHTYEGQSMTGMTDGVTDDQGHFRFDNVEPAPGRSFEVMVRYKDVTYFSDLVEPRQDQTKIDLPVTIYETTTDTSAVRVEQFHLLLDFIKQGTVQVSQVFILSNEGKLTVLTSGQQGLRFHLPAGATDVSFEGDRNGTRFVREEGGFLDTEPVVPGEGTLSTLVRYSLPYTDRIELDVPVDYPTANVNLLLPEAGVKPEGTGWETGQEMLLEKRVYQVYSYQHTPLAPKDTLRLIVTGRPKTSAATTDSASVATPVAVATNENHRWILLGGVVLSLALIGAGVLWWRRNQRHELVPDPILAAPDLGSESPALESILQTIAALDDAHEKGGLNDTEYRELRTRLRKQAVKLVEESELPGHPE